MSKNKKFKLRRQAVSKEKKKEGIELLAKGLNQSEVARKLGVTRQTVSYWFKSEDFKKEVETAKSKVKAKRENQRTSSAPLSKNLPNTENFTKTSEVIPSFPIYEQTSKKYYFSKELAMLDHLEEILMSQASEGSLRAAGLLIKLSERRSKLLCLDIPIYSEIAAFEKLSKVLPYGILDDVVSSFEELEQKLESLLMPLSEKSKTED